MWSPSIRPLTELRRLPRPERAFLVRAWVTVLLIRAALHIVALPVLLRWRPAVRHARAGPLSVDRVLALLDVAARHTPGRTTCLARAVAGCWLLAGEGVAASVHIGVARRGPALAAHAWLQHGATLPGRDDDDGEGYKELVGLEGGRPA